MPIINKKKRFNGVTHHSFKQIIFHNSYYGLVCFLLDLNCYKWLEDRGGGGTYFTYTVKPLSPNITRQDVPFVMDVYW